MDADLLMGTAMAALKWLLCMSGANCRDWKAGELDGDESVLRYLRKHTLTMLVCQG
jgi:hypothetical protein